MQRIALIMDEDFGEKMIALSEGKPLWAVASKKNSPVIALLWDKFPERNVTESFTVYEETTEEACIAKLYSIDEHFASNTVWGPYEAIEVYGMKLPESFANKITELEFSKLEDTDFGFRVWK